MNSNLIRRAFLDFFQKKGHTIVPSSSLVPDDPSVLFTTAGMQQFKKYFLGETSPFGSNVATSQKCFRTSDIDSVGDESHLTFFEMLGNFSFGGYGKREAIRFAWEFLGGILEEKSKIPAFVPLISGTSAGRQNPTRSSDRVARSNDRAKSKIRNSKLFVTVFGGDEEVPADEESYRIWRDEIGLPEELIERRGREDNFWGPTGEEGPCGPTTEIHYRLDSSRSIELWNLVFNEYYCSPSEVLTKEGDHNKKLTPLKQKGVDTGMGFERLAMVLRGKPTVFETDLFWPLIQILEKISGQRYENQARIFRIIVDHLKGAAFLIAEGILPSNIERGYVLRRLLRRVIRFARVLGLGLGWYSELIKKIGEIYQEVYPEIKNRENEIITVTQNEEEKFKKTLEQGLKNFKLQIENCRLKKIKIMPAKAVFDLYQSYGFPLELTRELAQEEGFEVDEIGFEAEFKKHQEISRAGVQKKFGGVGIEMAKTEEDRTKMARLHTATHLLHQALRDILGPHVRQMGSDINPERLRFDFTHQEKLTPEQIKKIEDIINQKIKEDLPVKKEEMLYDEAIKSGALAFFKEKYPEKVTVYSIGAYSKEICAGPHVEHTGELGTFKIQKEESSGAGVRRIRAVVG